jgi:OFA family oxalate/formate antiporter-like MFS transporter
MATDSAISADSENQTRWTQLIIGIVCMAMIANLQYGWSYFVDPMSKGQGWSRSKAGSWTNSARASW